MGEDQTPSQPESDAEDPTLIQPEAAVEDTHPIYSGAFLSNAPVSI